jgi:hypothetical protein
VPHSSAANRGLFYRQLLGASVFDPPAAADVAAQLTLDPLLNPKRLVRVYNQHVSTPDEFHFRFLRRRFW